VIQFRQHNNLKGGQKKFGDLIESHQALSRLLQSYLVYYIL